MPRAFMGPQCKKKPKIQILLQAEDEERTEEGQFPMIHKHNLDLLQEPISSFYFIYANLHLIFSYLLTIFIYSLLILWIYLKFLNIFDKFTMKTTFKLISKLQMSKKCRIGRMRTFDCLQLDRPQKEINESKKLLD